ncbi:MAG: hypothetical protein ACI4B3_01675 [Prevotella sp.]
MKNHPVYIEGEGFRYGINENHHRRLWGHDYSAPGVYMLTIVTEGRMPVFGNIEGDVRAKRLSHDWPHLNPSPLGKAVLEEETKKISEVYPMVELWRIALMPDHIHLIINIKENLPKGKTLGNVVAGFKGGCSRAWWRLQKEGKMPLVANATSTGAASVQATSGTCKKASLFAPGYNDRLLTPPRQLQAWKDYLLDNPYRLLVRRALPHHFQRSLCIEIEGRKYSAFGNFLLLRKPEKMQVFCHRKARYGQLTPEERMANNIHYQATDDATTGIPYIETHAFAEEKSNLLDAAYSGIPLVTPGISPGEKAIMNFCLNNHLPLIHIQQEVITPLWKPERCRFDACVSGDLLIIALMETETKQESSYALFHYLNSVAAFLCTLDLTQTTFKYKIM